MVKPLLHILGLDAGVKKNNDPKDRIKTPGHFLRRIMTLLPEE
jgi:hypothetical protein